MKMKKYITLTLCGILLLSCCKTLTKEELSEYVNEESKFITLSNGAEMHYRAEGNPNGKVLVMIHGGFGSLHNWEGWIPYLKNDYRLISMDLLGHGLTGAYPENIYTRISNRDAIRELLHLLKIDHYTIAGNSFGGGIALEMALAYPEEVKGLILIDSEGVPNGKEGYDASMFSDDDIITPDSPDFINLSWSEKLMSKFIGRVAVKKILKSLFYNRELLTKDYVNRFSKILRYDGNREAQILMFRQGFHYISTKPKMDLLDELSQIKCPTLVMHGKQDELISITVAETFHKEICNSQLSIIDQAGHMPMIEKPKETAQIANDFLKK
jgi:proline-specific peptidase